MEIIEKDLIFLEISVKRFPRREKFETTSLFVASLTAPE